MKSYFAVYKESYGLTLRYLGDYSSQEKAEFTALQLHLRKSFVINESELRGFFGSIQNVLGKIK